MKEPRCYSSFKEGAPVCEACYVSAACASATVSFQPYTPAPRRHVWTRGRLRCEGYRLALSLYSGQLFRFGRDMDGWWKGIAYGVAIRLRQDGEVLHYTVSSPRVKTYAGQMDAQTFLRWFLRLDERPRTRVARGDRILGTARRKMAGFRFVRQDPYECTISYILSVQARVALTKQRINHLARLLGTALEVEGERYWTFPEAPCLSRLDEAYYRHLRFGWRSKFLPISVRLAADTVETNGEMDLEGWRDFVDRLKAVPNSGVGLKVGKCIDLFSLERLGAVPVDTWVRKMAADWYGQEGSDAQLCRWAEERGGEMAGYLSEYLFVYYRELHAAALEDRTLSFATSEATSAELPVESVASVEAEP